MVGSPYQPALFTKPCLWDKVCAIRSRGYEVCRRSGAIRARSRRFVNNAGRRRGAVGVAGAEIRLTGLGGSSNLPPLLRFWRLIAACERTIHSRIYSPIHSRIKNVLAPRGVRLD